jgi:hypothetical protein
MRTLLALLLVAAASATLALTPSRASAQYYMPAYSYAPAYGYSYYPGYTTPYSYPYANWSYGPGVSYAPGYGYYTYPQYTPYYYAPSYTIPYNSRWLWNHPAF